MIRREEEEGRSANNKKESEIFKDSKRKQKEQEGTGISSANERV